MTAPLNGQFPPIQASLSWINPAALSNPGLRATVNEPDTGAYITRITNNSGVGNYNAGDKLHSYSRVRVSNADDTLIFLRFGHYLRTSDWTAISHSDPLNGNESRWSNLDPQIRYGFKSDLRTFAKHNVITGVTTDIFVLPTGYTGSIGNGEGELSLDDQRVVITTAAEPLQRAWCYNIQTGALEGTIDLSGVADFDSLTLSKSGSYLVGQIYQSSQFKRLYDWGFTNPRDVVHPGKAANSQHPHNDYVIDGNGDDVLVQVENAPVGLRLRDSAWLQLPDVGALAGHVSGCAGRSGYVYISTTPGWSTIYGGTDYFDQIMAIKVKPLPGEPTVNQTNYPSQTAIQCESVVELWGHPRGCGYTYNSNPMASVSRSGRFVVFRSIWEDSNSGNYPVNDYVMSIDPVTVPFSTTDTTPPVITVIGDNPYTVLRNTPFIDPNATAYDAIDGLVAVTSDANLIDTSLNGQPTQIVTYSSVDSSSNAATETRTVIVADTVTLPVMTGYWPLNEGTGSVAHDESINSNDLTINGANWGTGVDAAALEFNGSHDASIATVSSDLQSQELTLAAWCSPSTSLATWEWIAAQGDNYGLYQKPDTKEIIFYKKNVANGWDIISSGPLGSAFDEDKYVAATINASHLMSLYIDGVLAGTHQSGDGIGYTQGNGFTIGSMQAQRNFEGTIDEVRHYNSRLSAAQISILPLQRGGAHPYGITASVRHTTTLANIGKGIWPWAKVLNPYNRAINYAWTKVSGPGTAAFSDSTTANPQITFDNVGTYTLRLTINDAVGGTPTEIASVEVSVNVVSYAIQYKPEFDGSITNWGQAGALAAKRLPDGDGEVEFTVDQVGRYFVGLSDTQFNGTWNTGELDHSIFIFDNGTYAGWEGPIHLSNGYVDNYNPGDVFTIRRSGTDITYEKNGVHQTEIVSTGSASTAEMFVYIVVGAADESVNNVKVNGSYTDWEEYEKASINVTAAVTTQLGTPTNYYTKHLLPGVNSGTVVTKGNSTWLTDQTAIADFTDGGYAQAQGGVTDGIDGGVLPFDVTDQPMGAKQIWNRIQSESGTSDSMFMQKDTDALGFQFMQTTVTNEWQWVLSPLTLDGSEATVSAVVREELLKYDRSVIVDAAETAAPTGKYGYIGANNFSFDAGPDLNQIESVQFDTTAIFDNVTTISNISIVADDSNGVTIYPTSAAVSGTNMIIPITIRMDLVGTRIFTVNMTADGIDYIDAFTVTTTANQAPVLTDPGPLSAEVGVAFSQTLTYTDSESETATFSLYDASPLSTPSWLNVNPTTGELTGTPQQGDGGTNIWAGLRLTDSAGKVSDHSLNFTVTDNTNYPPVLTTPSNKVVTELDTISFDLVSTDPNIADTLIHSYVSGKESWMSITGNTVTMTPPAGTVNTYTVSYKANDGTVDSNIVSHTVTVSASATNNPPVIDPLVTQQATVGIPFSVQLGLSDSDNDTLTVTYDSVPAWLNATPLGLLSGTPAETDTGPVEIIATVSDGAAIDTQTITINVSTVITSTQYMPKRNGKQYLAYRLGKKYLLH